MGIDWVKLFGGITGQEAEYIVDQLERATRHFPYDGDLVFTSQGVELGDRPNFDHWRYMCEWLDIAREQGKVSCWVRGRTHGLLFMVFVKMRKARQDKLNAAIA